LPLSLGYVPADTRAKARRVARGGTERGEGITLRRGTDIRVSRCFRKEHAMKRTALLLVLTAVALALTAEAAGFRTDRPERHWGQSASQRKGRGDDHLPRRRHGQARARLGSDQRAAAGPGEEAGVLRSRLLRWLREVPQEVVLDVVRRHVRSVRRAEARLAGGRVQSA